MNALMHVLRSSPIWVCTRSKGVVEKYLIIMKRKIIVLFLLALFIFSAPVISMGQGFDCRYNIVTSPSGASVFFNGELIGETPLKKTLDFNFSKFPTCKLEIIKQGYISKEYLYTLNNKPIINSVDGKIVEVNLPLKISSIKFDSVEDIVFGFDKLIFGLNKGDTIGNQKLKAPPFAVIHGPIVWDEEFYKEVDLEKIIEKQLERAGFSVKNSGKLFSGSKSQMEPMLLIGGKLTKIKTNYTSWSGIVVKDFKSKIEINWEIFSIKKNKVIGSITSSGYYIDVLSKSVDNNLMSEEFGETFKEAAIQMIASAEFAKIIYDYKAKPKMSSAQKEVALNKVDTPSYKDYSKMVGGSVKSVVTVKVDGGHGSGFIISEDGFIVTNYHVVEGTSAIKVEFNAGFTLPAEVWSYNEDFDVALIKVNGSGFKPLSMKKDEETNIGDEVIAIGTPADVSLGQTVTKGIISGMREFDKKKLYQTDASINGGNSGGPLLNMKGEVIGINSYKLKGVGIDGLNFAIPTDVAIEKLHLTFK